jgi:hypothetical protein
MKNPFLQMLERQKMKSKAKNETILKKEPKVVVEVIEEVIEEKPKRKPRKKKSDDNN